MLLKPSTHATWSWRTLSLSIQAQWSDGTCAAVSLNCTDLNTLAPCNDIISGHNSLMFPMKYNMQISIVVTGPNGASSVPTTTLFHSLRLTAQLVVSTVFPL